MKRIYAETKYNSLKDDLEKYSYSTITESDFDDLDYLYMNIKKLIKKLIYIKNTLYTKSDEYSNSAYLDSLSDTLIEFTNELEQF